MMNLNFVKEMYEQQIGKWIDITNKSNQSQFEKDKRILELSHLASFGIALWDSEIINTIDEIEVINLSLQPDFIIRFKDELIGIELAQIKNDRAKEIGSLNNILKNSAKVFRKKYPNISILANIEFAEKSDIFDHNKESTYNTISKILFHEYSSHTQMVDFALSGAYWSGVLDSELVNRRIAAKESKIEDYKKGSKLDKIWLLLIVSGASPDSNYSYIPFDKIKGNGIFESIYLLDDFMKKSYKLNN